MWVTKHHGEKKQKLWMSMGTRHCLVPNILQNIFFRVHTGLEKVESKLWQNLNFWVDCSFSGQLEV